jgi:hypothetical protein
MEQGNVWVILSYDLVEEPGCHKLFVDLMTEAGWSFEAEGTPFPETTCVKESAEKSEKNAHSQTLSELKQIADRIRQEPGCKGFLIAKYFLVAHRVGPSIGSVGEDL